MPDSSIDSTKDERGILVDQLRDALDNASKDEDDAIELAVLAGLLARFDTPTAEVDEAKQWARSEEGKELLAAAFEELDLEGMLQGIEDVLEGDVADEDVEEAVFDFDDVVAAAVWAGFTAKIRPAVKQVAKSVRQVPEPFAGLSDFAKDLAKTKAVAQDLDVYDYLLAIADAGAWKE